MYIESGRYLAEHHSLDPEFIYMPGYVSMVAVVHALGGGLLAIKMIGVVAGGVAAAAVYATTRLLFGSAAALVAGLLAALWPGGVAVASVAATDMPGAALIAVAVWLLVRDAGRRPLGAPVMFADAHGGHTALVGANPNSEARYSRSLNRLFTEGTGHKLFASPHRESDR